MKIAILGHGTVGAGVTKLLSNPTKQPVNQLTVKSIWVRPEKVQLEARYTDDYQQILHDPEIEAVVEALGGEEPAATMIREALEHQKHVVTANNVVIALHLAEFQQLAQQQGVHLYFESSVGGGIPWIANLERVLRIDTVNEVQGIWNGTSNFILDEMTESGAPFDVVLSEAQRLGYAEADPSADIDGDDIENKLCISAALAYNADLRPGPQTLKVGIRNVTAADIHYFKQQQLLLKLMGKSVCQKGQVSLIIEPTLVPKTAAEASVRANQNQVRLHEATIGDLSLVGQGAGQLPTAHALVQDLLDIELAHGHQQQDLSSLLQVNQNLQTSDYVLRTHADVRQDLVGYDVERDADYYWIKQISAAAAHQLARQIKLRDQRVLLAAVA
ncbi:homoserine dehydrogenase [Fructilactobacillus carniphilus]|uniref:Homoserine dehydrogenase n=1 Tax=Fructilactobacillus carniphilus TaxID=2940297 RepID=A0ABY5BWW7_9LACO|nr:homoserine dehydrogenase [Fructilactobacillus carniphilus]USS90299.1 homoserine dehydrogenase [Fructilactobacillus carniphilus]